MRNKSIRQKGKKKKNFNFTISKSRAQRYEDIRPARVGKPWREKGRAHTDMVLERFENFITKGDRLANSRDVNPLETIWNIVDEKTYKEPAPKSLNELRQWLRFAWKSVSVDTLWELVHSVVFMASGQHTLSMRTYAPFRNVVRSNQRHDSGDDVKFKKLWPLLGR